MLPWAHPNLKGISVDSAVFAQLTAECRYILQRAAPFPLKIANSYVDLDPHLIHGSHPNPQPKRHLDRFSRFCTAHGRVSLYFTIGCAFLPQYYPFSWGCRPIHASSQPKRHLDRFSRFCIDRPTDRQTDRQTDRPRYSVGNDRPHLRTYSTGNAA